MLDTHRLCAGSGQEYDPFERDTSDWPDSDRYDPIDFCRNCFFNLVAGANLRRPTERRQEAIENTAARDLLEPCLTARRSPFDRLSIRRRQRGATAPNHPNPPAHPGGAAPQAIPDWPD